MKILIAYATKSGVTRESAKIIANVLEKQYNHEVDIVNLKEHKNPDIDIYHVIFIGSGIRIGRWYGRAKKMLEHDFGDKKVIIFLSACSAGDAEGYDDAINKYIDNVLKQYSHVRPFAFKAFGGTMKMFGKMISDNYDPEKVRVWAKQLGDKLK